MLLMNLGIFVGITLRSDAPELKPGEDTWSRENWRKDRAELADKPFWKSHHMWSALLIAVTLVMVAMFI
ncbi:hypothetical protein [Roseinatronobacter alkalisoli]|uniref:DUF1772 domain-containing protein n=1 Tax=Roseinatronobacter alkalisoli TaxID=3028235 RepID=A0ABT5TF34_9RHOB|nr:hypothetical protein [Roseinatronobacter sp. HJB301]MDD7972782.1 hypothetical protein [Roseinatronobacter sp. HJB301]